MRSSWVSQLDLKSNSKYPEKGSGEDAEGRHSCEEGNMGWNDAATSRGTPGATRNWKRWGRILSQSLWRECDPADALISDFCPAEMWKNKFWVLLTIYFENFITFLFIFGHCYMRSFSRCGEQGLLSSWGAQTSHCSGFPCCTARALGPGLQ